MGNRQSTGQQQESPYEVNLSSSRPTTIQPRPYSLRYSTVDPTATLINENTDSRSARNSWQTTRVETVCSNTTIQPRPYPLVDPTATPNEEITTGNRSGRSSFNIQRTDHNIETVSVENEPYMRANDADRGHVIADDWDDCPSPSIATNDSLVMDDLTSTRAQITHENCIVRGNREQCGSHIHTQAGKERPIRPRPRPTNRVHLIHNSIVAGSSSLDMGRLAVVPYLEKPYQRHQRGSMQRGQRDTEEYHRQYLSIPETKMERQCVEEPYQRHQRGDRQKEHSDIEEATSSLSYRQYVSIPDIKDNIPHEEEPSYRRKIERNSSLREIQESSDIQEQRITLYETPSLELEMIPYQKEPYRRIEKSPTDRRDIEGYQELLSRGHRISSPVTSLPINSQRLKVLQYNEEPHRRIQGGHALSRDERNTESLAHLVGKNMESFAQRVELPSGEEQNENKNLNDISDTRNISECEISQDDDNTKVACCSGATGNSTTQSADTTTEPSDVSVNIKKRVTREHQNHYSSSSNSDTLRDSVGIIIERLTRDIDEQVSIAGQEDLCLPTDPHELRSSSPISTTDSESNAAIGLRLNNPNLTQEGSNRKRQSYSPHSGYPVSLNDSDSSLPVCIPDSTIGLHSNYPIFTLDSDSSLPIGNFAMPSRYYPEEDRFSGDLTYRWDECLSKHPFKCLKIIRNSLGVGEFLLFLSLSIVVVILRLGN